MAQWGNTDDAANSVLWGVAGFKEAANATNQSAFYQNTTVGAFIAGQVAGQFAVDTGEMGVENGGIAEIYITNNGSGYTANVTSSITGGGGSNANVVFSANASGKIASGTISVAGSSYETNPTCVIAAPPTTTFNANSAVTAGAGGGANSVIALTTAGVFVAGDLVTYTVAAGNTAISGLTANTDYYIQFANSTVIALATTSGGGRITLAKGFSETGHSITGDTAEATLVVGGGKNKGAAHAGWVVRTVGTGGRAGRVQYETLVAMGSIASDDNDDDLILPDA